jgi:DNA polymerase III subunit beta
MKIGINTAEMVKALFRAQGIAEKKSTMPILAHVLLEARADQGLKVSATDHEVGLSGHYQANVHKPGAVAVHARQLYDIVKSLASDTLELESQDNNWVEIRSGQSRFRLVGMAAEEFPGLPGHGEGKAFTIPTAKLSKMIDRTVFCVSSDDNRHNLSGVYCETADTGVLRMVATDGHRLALIDQQLEGDIPLAQGVIVPRKAFGELRRVLSDGSEDISSVTLSFAETTCVFTAGTVTLSARLVDGQFPKYRQVVPQNPEKQVKLSRGAVGEALKRVSLLSQGRAWGVKMMFQANNLQLVAEDPELGDAHETIDIEYRHQPMTMGFNARYILDVLALIPEQGFVLELTDDLSPAIIKPLEEQGFLAVVMPMRI